jgi:hypothetical protein
MTAGNVDSVGSVDSVDSVNSVGSVGSVDSVDSVGSVGSVGMMKVRSSTHEATCTGSGNCAKYRATARTIIESSGLPAVI